ncbi:MAG: ribonuclease J [Sandaracinaceae bacterium]
MTDVSPVRLVPLGGLGEIGMNCLVIEHGEDRIVIDCGLTFDDRGLGIDVTHADFGWLAAHPERLRAIVLTHGHEDHVGAVPYLLEVCRAPIFGPKYALGVLRERLDQHPIGEEDHEIHAIAPGDKIEIGPFEVEPYRVTHSMPDCTGLIVRTPQGVVVHSGDFKIDEAPIDGETFDFDRLARLREEEGVRLLLSDSTNAIVEGSTGPEASVADALEEIIGRAEHRVVVTLFASNVHRVRSLASIARATGRKLCLLGRSLGMHSRIGIETGYLEDLGDVAVAPELLRALPRNQVLVLATGTQGEPPAAFARLAKDEHPDLALERGDLVIHSARVIPGCETSVFPLINMLERRGIEVLWRATHPAIHVSGHAHRGEQRRLLETLRPRAFIPVHGTFLHLRAHAELAAEVGVEERLIVENGTVVELDADSVRTSGHVSTGRIHRARGRTLDERVLKDRQLLAEHGIAVVSVAVDARGRPIAPLDLITRGLISEDDHEELLDEACDYVHDALTNTRWVHERPEEDELEAAACRALKRYFHRTIGRKPLCYATVLRVD